MQTCDLFVIGGGSGGVRAGRLAAEAGARVVLAENQNLGGTCVNLGCVPKKLFVYAADFSEAAADAAAFGWTAAQAGPMEWPVLRENKNREIARLNRAYQGGLEKAGVEVLAATARISGPNSVVANEREYRAEKILVAVGAKPVRLAIPGAEVGVVSDDMFHLESLPGRAVVVGGGYIALEFAGILAGLGVETTLCFRADLPLRGFDDDLRRVAAAEVAKRGVRFQAGSAPVRAEDSGGEKILSLANGEKLAADLILFATGRRPALDEVGLENAGVSPDEKGFLRADESFCVGGGGGGGERLRGRRHFADAGADAGGDCRGRGFCGAGLRRRRGGADGLREHSHRGFLPAEPGVGGADRGGRAGAVRRGGGFSRRVCGDEGFAAGKRQADLGENDCGEGRRSGFGRAHRRGQRRGDYSRGGGGGEDGRDQAGF